MTYKLKVEKSRVKDLPKEDMFEIEISSQEVYDIYIEKQHEFDLSDIKLVLDDLGDDDVLECYDFIKAQITDDMKDRMAYRMRKFIENDDSWIYARDEAINEIIQEEKRNEEC